MKINLQPYRPKAIRFLELWKDDGWEIKVYGISAINAEVEHRLLEIGKATARWALPRPPIAADRYGVACLTIHPSVLFNQIIVDWWERNNELRHRVFKAAPETPYEFEDITATGEAFCTWELRVLGFERQAWIDNMLVNPDGPDIEKYLSRRLDEDT